MEVIEFAEKRMRMCRSMRCDQCPLSFYCGNCDLLSNVEALKEVVLLVEQWAAEHPLLTRWTKLKKEYPKLSNNEKTQLCVCAFGYECDCDQNCAKHWDVPVDEEEQE